MVASLLAISALAATPLQVDVRYERFANLTYQLDNVTGQMPWEGSRNFRRLWDEKFLESAEDRRMLDRWKTLRSQRESQPERTLEVKFPIVPVLRDETQETRIRAAGFDSRSVSEYVRRASKLVDKDKAEELGEVIAHFEPRFTDWWREAAEPRGRRFSESMKQMLETETTQKALANFRDFYDVQLGSGDAVSFVMLYRPTEVEEDINGQQLGRHALVQFSGSETPSERLEVVVHELCHYFYQMADPRGHAGLQKRFLDSKTQPSVPAYNLLNEAVATALGNGVMGEILQKPEEFARHQRNPGSFYNDPDIDRAAKSIFPWVKERLRSGKTLFEPDFADGYLSRVSSALGASLQRPGLFFKSVIVVADEKLGQSVFQGVSQSLEPGTFSGYLSPFSEKSDLRMLESSPYISAVLIAKPEAAENLAKWGYLSVRELNRIDLDAGPHLVMALPNSNVIRAVIIARTDDDAKSALRKLAGMSEPLQGLVGR